MNDSESPRPVLLPTGESGRVGALLVQFIIIRYLSHEETPTRR